MPEKARAIAEAPSDKERLEQQSHQLDGSMPEITMQAVVSNAISQGITAEEVENTTFIEQNELKRKKELEGETKGD